MTDMHSGDLIELWETVDGSDFLRLLREAHECDPKVDPPDAFVETTPPHRTYRLHAFVTETDDVGRTVHKVLMKHDDGTHPSHGSSDATAEPAESAVDGSETEG